MKTLGSELRKELAPGRKESDSEMQGHPIENENQSSLNEKPSATTAMDELQSQPTHQSTSSAPQIRSRITVVCAECKRLKLKCDRRTPCGSCTKRDTVPRCIYSPAAAEKVDLHSLNNRLMQVESILSMVTAGQTPPPFQSSYPLAQVALPASHSMKRRANHTTTSTASSISIRHNDLRNIWLAHCQLDLYGTGNQVGHKFENSLDSSYVKLEPSPTDILLLPQTHHESPIIIDELPRAVTSTSSVHFDLPPLHVYYSFPYTGPTPTPTPASPQSNQYSYPTHNPYPTGYAEQPFSSQQNQEYEFPPSTHTPIPFSKPTSASSSGKPAASASLFVLLPSPPVRTKLLQHARAAHPHLALVTHWSKISELADPNASGQSKSEKEKEKARKKALASAIFFGTRSEPSPTPLTFPTPTATSSQTPTYPPLANLPIFASLCYLLALGALETEADPSTDPAFLYALAGQALGVWEEYKESVEVEENEKDDLDHLVARLLQVKYLIRVGSVTSADSGKTTNGLEAAFPLIGKLVNLARGLGISQEPEEDTGSEPKRGMKVEEKRRMIWWDIMFYDAFVSDALNHTALVSLFSYTTNLPAIAQIPGSVPSRSSRSFRTEGESDIDLDLLVEGGETDDGLDKDSRNAFSGMKLNGSAKSKQAPRGVGRGKGKGRPSELLQASEDGDNGFFGVRCRLTRLAQSIKHQLSHPGCECCTCGNGSGYTLDQAVKLEGDIRTWVAELPASLKHDSSTNPRTDACRSAKHAALSAELAIMANRMIISAYVPLMRPSSHSSAPVGVHSWSPASRATVDAAQGIVRASRVLHRLWPEAGSGSASRTMLKEYYPLDKAVLDAVVICAHAGLAGGTTKSHHQSKAIMDEVVIGMEVLHALHSNRGEMGRIVGSLKRRLEGLGVVLSWDPNDENALKRKHHRLETSPQEQQGDGASGTAHSFDLDSSHKKADGLQSSAQDSPIVSMHQVPRQLSRPSTPQRNHTSRVRSSHEVESDKKHGKKGYPAYPAFGVRDRGKNGAPWIAKSSTGVKNPEPRSGGPPPLMTSDTRTPDNGVTYQSPNSTHNQSQPSPFQNNPSHTMNQDNEYRSRSSSIIQPLQPVDHPMSFDGSEDGSADMHCNQRRRFSHDLGQQPQLPEASQGYAISPSSLYNAAHDSRSGSFDAPRGYDQHRGSFDQNAAGTDSYGSVSSPYPSSSAPLSTASSPYGSTNGPPPTPTFGPGPGSSHRPSPPVFGPQATTAGSQAQTYYHIPTGFDAPYDGHGQQQLQPVGLGGGSMDTSMGMGVQNDNRGSDGMAPPSSIPSTPLYEKSQSQLYDVKPMAEPGQQPLHHQMHYQVAGDQTGLADPRLHLSQQQTWNNHPQYIPPQPMVDHGNPQYWNGNYYQ